MTLTREDLWSLEQYAEKRPSFRTKVLEHKKNRFVLLTPNARLIFEDEMTLRYQIQEMLRIEKVFEADGIQDELDVYNPMIPDGNNWKCTFMIEYDDIDERRIRLAELKGVEDLVWIQVEGFEKSFAIADEDLDRENEEKTSSVHFMRFQLTPEMVSAALADSAIIIGCAHENMNVEQKLLPENVRASLLGDLKEPVVN